MVSMEKMSLLSSKSKEGRREDSNPQVYTTVICRGKGGREGTLRASLPVFLSPHISQLTSCAGFSS